MDINLYIGPDLRFAVTPHSQPTFDELIHNGSLNVQGPIIHPITHRKYLTIQITVSSNGAQATDVRVKLFATTCVPASAAAGAIDQLVLNMIAGSPLVSWLGQTILYSTWTSNQVVFMLPNETDKVAVLAATVECPNMPQPGPSLSQPTLDQCVGIYVRPF